MEISVTQASNGFIKSEYILWWARVTLMTLVAPVTTYLNFKKKINGAILSKIV